MRSVVNRCTIAPDLGCAQTPITGGKMAALATVHQQFRRVKNYVGFLREAECPADQIRLRGMGVLWSSDLGPLQRGNELKSREPEPLSIWIGKD